MNKNRTTTDSRHAHYESAHIYRLLEPALEALHEQSPERAFDLLEEYRDRGILTERQISGIMHLWERKLSQK